MFFRYVFFGGEVGGDVGAIVLTSGKIREIVTFRWIDKSSKNDQIFEKRLFDLSKNDFQEHRVFSQPGSI